MSVTLEQPHLSSVRRLTHLEVSVADTLLCSQGGSTNHAREGSSRKIVSGKTTLHKLQKYAALGLLLMNYSPDV